MKLEICVKVAKMSLVVAALERIAAALESLVVQGRVPAQMILLVGTPEKET